MTEYYRSTDGGRWIVQADEAIYVDPSGHWSPSVHSPNQLRRWTGAGILAESSPFPFTLSATPAP